jgi:hypothetical protein
MEAQQRGPCSVAPKYVAASSMKHVSLHLHVKCKLSVHDFNQIWSLTGFYMSPQYQISQPAQLEPRYANNQTDRHDDTKSLFVSNEDAPKKSKRDPCKRLHVARNTRLRNLKKTTERNLVMPVTYMTQYFQYAGVPIL